MTSLPESVAGQPLLDPDKSNIVMGRQDFTSVLLRAIAGELYKIRRRPMSKVLLSIAIVIMILGFGIVSLPAIIKTSAPVEAYLPPACSQTNSNLQIPCLNHSPTREDLARAAQDKQTDLRAAAAPLFLPGSLNTSVSIIYFIGVMLLIILAGTIVGGEYSIGTIRLMLTRGPTRTQFLLSKVGTMLACSFVTLITLLLIGIIVGALLNLATGVAISFTFLRGIWILHCLLFLLAATLGLFVYSLLAICLSTLGKATAAGATGALIWWFMERILSSVLPILGMSSNNAFGNFLRALPDYFIGNNIGALLDNQSLYMNGAPPGPISDLHAILVLVVYIAVFVGVAWWANQARDIIN